MIAFWKQQLGHTEGDPLTNLCVLSCNSAARWALSHNIPVTKLPLHSIGSLPAIVLTKVSLQSFPSEK